jgi:hypothetical protein
VAEFGQIWAACHRVMRSGGLGRVTHKAVFTDLKRLGISPGSKTRVGPVVRQFKAEMAAFAKMPPALEERVRLFAAEIWSMALAAVKIEEEQQGGFEPQPRKKRKPRERLGAPQQIVLAQAVEDTLSSTPAKHPALEEPATAVEILKRLDPKLIELYHLDENHITRSLRGLVSKVVYRDETTKKWWRTDRSLPDGYGSPKVKPGYKSVGTPRAKTRKSNELDIGKAIAFLAKQKGRPATVALIIEKCGISEQGSFKFTEALRRRLGNRNPPYQRNDRGEYLIAN